MTDYNQELYWRERQRRVALGAAAAVAASGDREEVLREAKSVFVQKAFADDATPETKATAVKELLAVANGDTLALVQSTSVETATVEAQFSVIMEVISTLDEPTTASISVPVNANINATDSYMIPTGVQLTIGTYGANESIRSGNESYTIKGENSHLFKAEGGKLIINGGSYVVTGDNKYVIRSGFNPTDPKLSPEEKSAKAGSLTGSVVINGGTFKSDSYVMTVWYGSDITIKGGTFESPSAIFSGNGNAWCANANLTIYGGEFVVANEDADADDYTSVIGYWPVGNGKLTVNGGTFTINTPKRPATTFAIRAGQGEITGGTFNITACDVEATGKVGDAKTTLRAGMFTVTSNATYLGEPTAAITVSASKFTKPEIPDIVVLDSVEPVKFDKLLEGTDMSAYAIKKFIVKDGEVTEA